MVLEPTSITLLEKEQLNGMFSFLTKKKDNENQDQSVINRIEEIKAENGFNDLMFMKPEQAATTLNTMLTQLAYEEAEVQSHNFKSNNSIDQQAKNAKRYSDAASNVMSQFRQYALGMDGELKSLGTTEKTINGFKFKAPFYKLVLPESAQNTSPTDIIGTADLASLLAKNNILAPTPAPIAAPKDNTMLIVGGSIAGLLVIGGIAYAIKSKKSK
ncbi:hypothetical protein JJL45_09200 [Tamlana sp. s12]|uniref:hypothetical protein n=1 Tax=Tamlana sp. s12 TaxID=1630406 RepID=UPI0007FCEAAB|nr:hypothetical protein [Tamlana sp. s12]OBQ52868.1 hypothetical protein VQ01_13045 [Tamlana sp. s12]QQY81106.1 hypothetical protein JJL45_09200 [Tamlana sp. s12]